MTGVLFVLCATVAVAGVITFLAAWTGTIPLASTRSTVSTGLWTRSVDKVRAFPARTWIYLATGLAMGAILMLRLQAPVLLIVTPLAAVGLPYLLSDPPQTDIRLLEALDRWIRGMLAQLSTGKSIQDALRLSVRGAPPLLADALATLVLRLDGRWPTPQALHAMADELNSSDADAVLAALILSTGRGGTGATVTLYALADAIQDRLRALREVEAERSKPRAVVRQVTIITVVALAGFMILSPAYFTPYSTPFGQALLLGLLSAYAGSVAAMRRLTVPRPRARILRGLQ